MLENRVVYAWTKLVRYAITVAVGSCQGAEPVSFGGVRCGCAVIQGCLAEMYTGEGKTLMATLAAYLNALAGESGCDTSSGPDVVHVDPHRISPLLTPPHTIQHAIFST